MKGVFLLFAIFFLCIRVFVHAQGPWRNGEMEVRIILDNKYEANDLGRLGLNGDIYAAAGYAILYVTPGELETLKSGGFRYEILKQDLNRFSGEFWLKRDQYHTYDEIIQIIDSLCYFYPEICKKYDYGLSLEGRELCAIKISDNVNDDESEPEVMFDGGIHGDEIGGPENLVRFARHLCESYMNDSLITDLIDTREIWLYIMVNPDGRANMSRYNSNGVDLNRDWGYMWSGDGSSPGYYSQPETQALRNCMLENQFVVHTSYHSGSVYLSYPWSYRPDSCPDHYQIDELAGIYSSTSGYFDLEYGQGYTGMYPINGSSKDAYYGIMGSIGWTIEISAAKQPPSSDIQYYYDVNEPAMLSMIRYAGYGISGTVTDASTGAPVAATIFINDYFPSYTDPEVGDYHKYLLAGNYSVKVVANGYQIQIQTAVVADTSTTVLNFALQPINGHYAYRVIACGIPIDNFADEAKTFAAIGPPDGVNYSLGRSGWIILDMQDEITDIQGYDLIIYEGGDNPEGFTCYAGISMDGPWILVGQGMGTTSFDLALTGITDARYIRIVDDGDGPSTGAHIGFDLDAAEAPGLIIGTGEDYPMQAVLVYPNPVKDKLFVHFTNKPGNAVCIKITDISGRIMGYYKIDIADFQYNIIIPTSEFRNSLYLISISDQEGKILFSEKIIKN